MTVVATVGDWAALIVAIFWAVLVVALAALLANLLRVVTSLKGLVDGITAETIPLLDEVGTTVRSVNREFERVDAIAGSVQHIAQNAETISATVKTAISNPLVKALAFAAGTKRAAKKMRDR